MNETMKWSALVLVVVLGFSCNVPLGPDLSDTAPDEVAPADNGVLVDPEQGIVAGFTLDENIGADSPAEIVGDAQWVPGISGSAVEFDAEGEFVYLPDADGLDLGQEGSVEAWIFPYTNIIGAGIVHKGVAPDYSDEAYSLQYWQAGHPAMIIQNEGPTYLKAVSGTSVAENEWHHVVGVWDASTLYLYVDGVLSTSTAIPDGYLPLRNSDGGLLIGSQLPEPNSLDGNGYYRFEGVIDEVNVFNRALGAQEIADRHAALAS